MIQAVHWIEDARGTGATDLTRADRPTSDDARFACQGGPDGDDWFRPPCGHAAHANCLRAWADAQPGWLGQPTGSASCASCRQPFGADLGRPP